MPRAAPGAYRIGLVITRLVQRGAVAAALALSGAAAPGDAAARDATDPPTAAERRFAAVLARAIAADVRDHRPTGPLARMVVRWVSPEEPGDVTVHVLSERERRRVDDFNAWYPLEWRNVDREMRRSERIRRAVKGATRRSNRRYDAHPSELPDEVTPSGERLAPPPLFAALRRMPRQLRRANVPVDRYFAMSASHIEGDGALPTLRALASRKLLAALRHRGELPRE